MLEVRAAPGSGLLEILLGVPFLSPVLGSSWADANPLGSDELPGLTARKRERLAALTELRHDPRAFDQVLGELGTLLNKASADKTAADAYIGAARARIGNVADSLMNTGSDFTSHQFLSDLWWVHELFTAMARAQGLQANVAGGDVAKEEGSAGEMGTLDWPPPGWPPPMPPVANDDSYAFVHDRTFSVPSPGVLENDYDMFGRPLSASAVSGPYHAASFTLNSDGSFSYTPEYHYVGADSFVYQASNGVGTDDANVSITVGNIPPVAENDTGYGTDVVTSLVVAAPGVLANDYDTNGDPITAVLNTGPAHGTLDYLNADGSFKYTPNGNYAGVDTFQYDANDGIANSTSPATVSINVAPKADLDIEGLDETQEDSVGGLVVRKADGNDAPRKKITLAVQPPSWSGTVELSRGGGVRVFTASTGGTEITFNGYDNVFSSSSLPLNLYVEGSSASITMRDVDLTLQPWGPGTSDSVKFTVLWVDPVDVQFSGTVSNDNDSREAYRQLTLADHYLLGLQEFEFSDGDAWGWGTEARGLVHPADFEWEIARVQLERNGEFRLWDEAGGLVDSKPFGEDPTLDPLLRDSDPTDSPNGAIYDLDAPRAYIVEANANSIRRYRGNFEAFAAIWLDGQHVRASLVRKYYVRFSIEQVDAPSGWSWIPVCDLPGDNIATYGTTNLTWNLQ